MKRIKKQLSFFDRAKRLEKVNQFDKLKELSELVPWESFRGALERGLGRKKDMELGGRPPFDAVKMFKVLILQRLYNLSDEQAEFRLNDSFSFQRFVGLGVEEAAPDAKTIWLYRETLSKTGCLREVFDHFNKYLAAQGVTATKGTIVDATIVSVPKKKLTDEAYEDVKEGEEPKEWNKSTHQRAQMDTDARLTMKGGKSLYGYKNHVNVDAKYKIIQSFAVTDAALHDSKALPLVVTSKTKRVWADAAYDTQAVREHLSAYEIEAMVQKQRRSSSTPKDKYTKYNAKLSKVRKKVEHVFAFQVVVMKAAVIRCVGKVRALATITLNNLTYNMMRYRFLMA